MSTTFGQASAFLTTTCALLTVGALSFSNIAAAAGRRPCDCDNLELIEEHIKQQQFLHELFASWADYVPASLLTPQNVRDRANAMYQLAFYGTPTEIPNGTGSGAGASAGTLLDPEENCPLVKYLYDKRGNPILRETHQSRKEHRRPPEIEQAWRRITEKQFPSHECAAIVEFTVAHELLHQKTCRSKDTPKSKWSEVEFFIRNDKLAYAEGLKVLYDERKRLQEQCKRKPPRDGRWHGTIEYAYVYNESDSEIVEKGKDIVHPNGEGEKQWGTRKSVRARADIDAPAAGGNIEMPYRASRQEAYYNKSTFAMHSECGSFKKTLWKLDFGTETRAEAKLSATADGVLQIDEESGVLTVNYRVADMQDGTLTRRDWDKPEGYCQEHNNHQTDNSYGRGEVAAGFSVSMKVEIDRKHPDDIEATQIQPDGSGKGLHYRTLRLHRRPAQ